MAMPVAMLNANGINAMVRNAGTASSNASHSICRKLFAMRTPTMIRAGDVIADTAANVSTIGKKKTERANKPAVTTAVIPVRPPAATPAADSTYDVTVDVPRPAPDTVAMESAMRARPARGSLLFLSSLA